MLTATAHRRSRTRGGILGVLAAALVLSLAPTASSSATTTTPAPRRIVSGWVPYWTTAAGLASVTANGDLFSDVSPFWYSARGNAPSISLVSLAGGVSIPSTVAALHAKGVKVLPTITDGSGAHDMSAQLSSATGRARLVTQIVALVTSRGYDGIDLDWEGFAFSDGRASWAATRPRWVAFVASLSASLHARHKLLAVTVPGGTDTGSDSTGYWVYAWSQIGPRVDRLRVMAYDYHVASAGPIAPLPWVTAVAARAVSQVSSTKVQIGIASYGRDWYVATAGRCPNVASTTLLDRLSWAKGRHEFDARTAASYVSGLFVKDAATVQGISRVKAAVATWDAVDAERTFSYQVAFGGTYQSPALVTHVVAGLSGATTVIVDKPVAAVVGSAVAGTGVAAGSVVVSVAGNLVTLSKPLTAAPSGTLTFVTTTTTPATTVSSSAVGSNSLEVGSSAGVLVGATVSGQPGIPGGTTVQSSTTDTSSPPVTTVTLDKALTAPIVSGAAVSFASTSTTTATAVGGVAGSPTVTVDSTSGLTLGAAVSGTGVAKGATLTAVSGHVLTLSAPNSASVTGALTVSPPAVATSCTVTRTGWYDDASSASARAALVGRYHLAGIAEWTIGGEDLGQWSLLRAYARRIAPRTTSVVVRAPATMLAGRTAKLTATVRVGAKAFAGATVVFYWQRAGTKTWTRVATTRTLVNGVASAVTPKASRTGTWRAVVSSTWSTLSGSGVAKPTRVLLLGSVTPTHVTVSAKVGKAAYVRGIVRPVAVATKVTLQRRSGGHWVLVTVLSTDRRGHVSYRVPSTRRTSIVYRLVLPATATHTAAVSPLVTVHIA
jgi:spore germination protein YaaH